MYEQFFGFSEEPFRLSPDSNLCYRHASYKKALAYMQYALHRSEGFVMVTGQPGTGKTTLIRDLVSELSDGQVAVANLECTQLEADDLLRTVVFRFGLDGSSREKSMLLNELDVFLRRLHRDGRRALLVIDEAQALPMSAIEELRLLTNLNQDNKPLLQIFLIGQEELRELVHSPKLEQLHQRLVASCHLFPLDAERTEEYVKYRLRQVGWDDDPSFDEDVFPYIHQFSLGIPRWINMICSRILLHGMVEEVHEIGLRDLHEVLDGLVTEQLLPAGIKMFQADLLTEMSEKIKKKVTSDDVSPESEASDYDPSSAKSIEIDGLEFDALDEADEDEPADKIQMSRTRVASVSSVTSRRSEEKKKPLAPLTLERVDLGPEQNRSVQEAVQIQDDLEARRQKIKQRRDDLVKDLYGHLKPLVRGKTPQQSLVEFLRFMHGQEVGGSVLSLPSELSAMGLRGFAAWLKYTQQSITPEAREITQMVFDQMVSDLEAVA